jgi:hypothetical protein
MAQILLFRLKNKMKTTILLFLFTFSFFSFSIERSAYYNALKSNSVSELSSMIENLENEKSTPLNRAFKGALIAKKASFEKTAAAKIKLFKSGIELLENEISKSSKEIEYRFLRLAIQENCPKILKYNKNINEDVKMITAEYSTLNKALQKVILDYAKDSISLNSSSLK